ncbi:MAG TPA: hypothetical protein VFB54_07990 [Burkholderiales bacterium]|nr:hypothetical protein [Burkholderiales bacterium]
MRLTAGHKRWVYRAGALVFVTGVLWLVFHYFLRIHGEFGETPHPLEAWWLRLHGAGAMLALLVVGSLLPIHIRTGWHHRRNLWPGFSLLAVTVALALTGYALYYFGGESLRPVLSVVHWGVGLLAAGVMLWHIRSGHATRRLATISLRGASTELAGDSKNRAPEETAGDAVSPASRSGAFVSLNKTGADRKATAR